MNLLTNKNRFQSYLARDANYPLHGFHLVRPRPWPLLAGFAALCLTRGGVLYIHAFQIGFVNLLFGLVLLLFRIYVWWRDVVREACYEGLHTTVVQNNHRLGMILFIVSEIFFFVAFFWAYFHASIAPAIQIGASWPPIGISAFDPWEVPFLNTIILLLRGCRVTWAHHRVLRGKYKESVISIIITIFLALFFTFFQGLEYVEARFHISDRVYGRTFFIATGFHGLHVQVGTIFLIVCTIRLINNEFSSDHHGGIEFAIWYWHFVDVVWLFLFVAVYFWGRIT